MKIIKSLMNYEDNLNLGLTIDFDQNTLKFWGDPSCQLEETYDSVEAMNQAYQEKIAPYLVQKECYDLGGNQDMEVIKDLKAYRDDLLIQSQGETIPEDASLENKTIIEFTNQLRQLINKVAGPKPMTLHSVGFTIGDSGIEGITFNSPLFAGKTSEAEVKQALEASEYSLWKGEFHPEGAYSWEMQGNGLEDLEEYGDPDNYYDPLVSRCLELACARIQDNPCLRANLKTAKPFIVFCANRDEDQLSWKWREEAQAFAKRPAEEYLKKFCA
ncbi:MAG: hypothetical protein KDK66_06925 [Deltaproteobacteria bacterium]|nr:hypothetical protein [Deltaproteobacteria bacterium]